MHFNQLCRVRGHPLRTWALALLVAALPATVAAQDPPVGSQQPATARADDLEPDGLFPEPAIIDSAISFAQRRFHLGDEPGRPKSGFYPELSNMPTGAGWISLGPGYRHWLFSNRAVVDASAALSWRSYKMAQVRFEFPTLADARVMAGSQFRWQDLTQVTYFGEGEETLESTRSEYRLKSTNVVGYVTLKPVQWLSVGGRIGWLDAPSILPPTGSFTRGNPSTEEVFPDDAAYSVATQPAFVHGDLSVAADTRDHRSHPTRGGLYRASWARYADRDAGTFSFRRYEAEGAQFVPVAGSRLVLALHGWLVGSDTSEGDVIPFYLLPSLGGSNTLRAYTDFRFHDRNMVVLNAEARVALFTHVDAAVFADAGNVSARVADLNLDKRAYGIGFRVHAHESTFARFDIAHGEDGWRFFFRLSDPLHLTRLSRRTAAVPFVP